MGWFSTQSPSGVGETENDFAETRSANTTKRSDALPVETTPPLSYADAPNASKRSNSTPKLERTRSRNTERSFGSKMVVEPDVVRSVSSPEGKGLMITIVRATNLRNAHAKEEKGGMSDPFCICDIGRKAESRFQTNVVKGELNPVWNFAKQVLCYGEGESISFVVYDRDEGTSKHLLGNCDIKFDQYYPNGCEQTLEMRGYRGYDKNDKHSTGPIPTLQVKVQVLGRPKVREPEDEPTSAPKGHRTLKDWVGGKGLAVTVVSAVNLANRDNNQGSVSDPFVHVEIPNRGSEFKTPVVWNSLNPVWNHKGQLLNYKVGDPIKFVVWDKDDGMAKSRKGYLLGKAELYYEDYCNGVEGRLKLPSSGGRKAAYLSIVVEVLGPPDGVVKVGTVKKAPVVELHARETKLIFLKWLRHRRGSTYRAWRLDVDRKNTNKVSYTDMMESCRHLGLSLKEARYVWRSYRPPKSGCPATPLEFPEFDPLEWANINHFLEVMWEELNFDLDLAWSIMDPRERGWITLQEFITGMERMNFTGDVRLIFNGLDTSGQGRIWRHEMEYLKLLTPESHVRPENSPLVQEFVEWSLLRYGAHGAQALVMDLGMRSGGHMLTVRKFAERLARLGYATDPLHTAIALSRSNVTISINDVFDILGRSRQQRASLSYAGRKCVFKPAQRQKTVTDNTIEKPEWDATIYDPTRLNSRLGVRERHYFSRPFDRPLRDQMHAELEDKTGWQMIQEGDRGEYLSKAARRKKNHGLASRNSYLVLQDILPKSEDSFILPDSGVSGDIGTKEKLASSSSDSKKYRVYVLGCKGMLGEDDDEPMLSCTLYVTFGSEDSGKTFDPRSFQVDKEMTAPNNDNLAVIPECEDADALDFEFHNGDDVLVATAHVPATQFAESGFDGEIQLMTTNDEEEEEAIEDAMLVLKIVGASNPEG